MGKSSELVLLLALSMSAAGLAVAADSLKNNAAAGGEYALDEAKAAAVAEAKEVNSAAAALAEDMAAAGEKAAEQAQKKTPQAQIVREEIEGGFVEKLLSPEGRVIAEKTVKDDEVVKKILNYYHPDGSLSRRVTAMEDDKGFYAEDYYPNSKLAAQATYLNESNKIGVEKKYDNNGVLRQEVPWVLPKEDKDKPLAEQRTIRRGNIVTYYPNGRKAASFPVGKEGKTVFYDRLGKVIREVRGARVLNFSPELNEAGCPDKVSLSLQDLVELYEDEGDISYNKCGLPYRENFVYEITDARGNIATKISYDDTGMIRKMTPYQGGLRNGVEQKFDASGNVTAEINYKQGVKDGEATGYFPSKSVAFRKTYDNGAVEGKLSCYFPTGEVAAEFNYQNGKKEGTARVYGPQARTIEFADGEIVGAGAEKPARSPVVSKLAGLKNPDAKCLDIKEKIAELTLDVDANANTIAKNFTINRPVSCRDFSSFKPENSKYVCYDTLGHLRAVLPTGYNRGEYAVETVYSAKGKQLYDIPYYQKQRQGFARQYDDKGKVVAEMYFDRDELAESSRSYHANGAVKEMLTIADGSPRRLFVRYEKDGSLAFSANYRDGEKTDAFLSQPDKNKDIYLRYYDGALDNIREVNAGNPRNYIEYNLAAGEYTVYRNNELIKGGKLCGYENVAATPLATSASGAQPAATAPAAASPVAAPTRDTTETMAAITSMIKAAENPADATDKKPAQPAPIAEKAPAPQTEDKPVLPEQNAAAVAPEENEPITEKTPVPAKEPVAAVSSELKAEPTAPAPALQARTSPAPVAPAQIKAQTAPATPAQIETPEAAPQIQPEPKPVPVAPVLPAEAAPLVEDLEPISFDDIKVKNAIIPTAEDKKEEELAARNIGPVARPDIGELADVVDKEHLGAGLKKAEGSLEKTEKFYYPNKKLRKTVRTKGSRTVEVKEYSKTGLLLTDTMYRDDDILTEKYFGSGEIRRKTLKAYTDNPVMAFLSREDFYDSGKTRYEIRRTPDTLLFADKSFAPDGSLQQETAQISPLAFTVKEYGKGGKLAKVTRQLGANVLAESYASDGKISALSLNGAAMPLNLAKNTESLLKDNLKTYAKNGAVASEFKTDAKKDTLLEYYPNGKVKTEIAFYRNGEIDVKAYDKEGGLEKSAFLAPDGKLHLQKPSARTIPSYRERYWVDYNNPRWIENQDKYSVKSIGRLNLDTAAYILAELEADVPEILKKLYEFY